VTYLSKRPQQKNENARQKSINEMKSQNKNSIVFYEDLIFNPLNHKHQPKYKKLNEEEKKILLNTYGIKEIQLPRIEENDAISKYYGLYLNDIIEITRTIDTNGYQKYYRIVK